MEVISLSVNKEKCKNLDPDSWNCTVFHATLKNSFQADVAKLTLH